MCVCGGGGGVRACVRANSLPISVVDASAAFAVLTRAETFRITMQLCVDKRSRDTWDHLTMYAADTDAIFVVVVVVYVCRRRETGATSPWCWIVSSSSSSPPPTCVGPSPSFSMPLPCTTDAST